MTNQLEQLRKMTRVVADTGDIQAIRKFQPLDATTNPSLVYKAAQQEQYQKLLEECINKADQLIDIYPENTPKEKIIVEIFSVAVGCEINKIIKGRVSTEVDASLSFNTQAMIETAKRIIDFYQSNNVDRSRVLIKLAATWEGIEAARTLEKQGIQCNITLIFSFYQALAAAQANTFLISPFVGRILDWHKQQNPEEDYAGKNDPGVQSVTQIFNHFKQYDYNTIVMGASFRNIEEIQHLAGCDYLTISPELMSSLEKNNNTLKLALNKEKPDQSVYGNHLLTEEDFRWHINEDEMANSKLAEGIRNFNKDQKKLEVMIKERLS